MSLSVDNRTKRFTAGGTPAASDHGAAGPVGEGDLVLTSLRDAKIFLEDHSI